jgi:hypothetical protein
MISFLEKPKFLSYGKTKDFMTKLPVERMVRKVKNTVRD